MESVRIEITWKSIFKILAGVLLGYVLFRLWPVFELLIAAILIAVPLHRMAMWLCQRGWPRWAGVGTASLSLVLLVLGIFGLAGPLAFNEASNLVKNLPKIQQQVAAKLPAWEPLTRGFQNAINSATGGGSQQTLENILNAATSTAKGIFNMALVVVFAVYLIAEGPRTQRWLVAFSPDEHRQRVSRGLSEIADRIVAYVGGQSIVSALFATFVFVFLSILGVPMALLLAVMAAVFDVLPLIGIFLAGIPAALIALTISPTTALIVAAGYTAYHLLEFYFIVPKVYGKRLQLSTLAVLLSFIAAATLGGIVAAIAVLPLVAAYPALEKLWLRSTVQPEVIKEHDAQRRAA